MKFRTLFIFTILLSSISLFSQERSEEIDNSLDNQFKTLYRKSSTYQEYKVIRKTKYNLLHKNVLDSVADLKNKITTKNNLIETQKSSIDNLEKEKTNTQQQLNDAIKKEKSISLFGANMTKTAYSILLFSIIIILIIVLLYFIYRFKNSNVLTIEAKYNLEEVENEFNTFRKKSIAREQKLRRELQDIIIKNRDK